MSSILSDSREVGDAGTVVESYAKKCKELDADIVLEFLWAITDPSVKECRLTNRLLQLRDADLLPIAEALEVEDSIETLDLDCNRVTHAAMEGFGKMLNRNNTLTSVILSHNAIGDVGCVHIAQALQQNGILLKLDLCSTDIGARGIEALAAMLSVNTTLKELYLDSNNIDDESAVQLCKGTQLTSLHLAFNSIEEKGASAIGDLLASSKCSLTSLDLSANRIGPKGGQSIATALFTNSSLKCLNIRSNAIRSDGIEAFGSVVVSNTYIQHLYLGCNHALEPSIESFVKKLQGNRTLVSLDLMGYNVSPSAHFINFASECPELKLVFLGQTTIKKLQNDTFWEEAMEIRGEKEWPNLATACEFDRTIMKKDMTEFLKQLKSKPTEGGSPAQRQVWGGCLAGTIPSPVKGMSPTPSAVESLFHTNQSPFEIIHEMEKRMDEERKQYRKQISILESRLSMSNTPVPPDSFAESQRYDLPRQGSGMSQAVDNESSTSQNVYKDSTTESTTTITTTTLRRVITPNPSPGRSRPSSMQNLTPGSGAKYHSRSSSPGLGGDVLSLPIPSLPNMGTPQVINENISTTQIEHTSVRRVLPGSMNQDNDEGLEESTIVHRQPHRLAEYGIPSDMVHFSRGPGRPSAASSIAGATVSRDLGLSTPPPVPYAGMSTIPTSSPRSERSGHPNGDHGLENLIVRVGMDDSSRRVYPSSQREVIWSPSRSSTTKPDIRGTPPMEPSPSPFNHSAAGATGPWATPQYPPPMYHQPMPTIPQPYGSPPRWAPGERPVSPAHETYPSKNNPGRSVDRYSMGSIGSDQVGPAPPPRLSTGLRRSSRFDETPSHMRYPFAQVVEGVASMSIGKHEPPLPKKSASSPSCPDLGTNRPSLQASLRRTG